MLAAHRASKVTKAAAAARLHSRISGSSERAWWAKTTRFCLNLTYLCFIIKGQKFGRPLIVVINLMAH